MDRFDRRVLATTSLGFTPLESEDGTVEFAKIDAEDHPWVGNDIDIGESYVSDPIFFTSKIAQMDFVSEVDPEGEYI